MVDLRKIQTNFWGLFNAKAILVEEQQGYYFTHSWADKGVHTFPKGISPKVKVTAQLELEFVYFEAAVQHISHYDITIPPDPLDDS